METWHDIGPMLTQGPDKGLQQYRYKDVVRVGARGSDLVFCLVDVREAFLGLKMDSKAVTTPPGPMRC
jgi:hypothetical protein